MRLPAPLALLLCLGVLGLSACAESGASSDDWQPSPQRSGAVTASVLDGAASVVAWFEEESPACETRTDGACTVQRCVGPTPPSVRRNAGWITAATADGRQTLEPGPDNRYDNVMLPWTTPAPLAITATGGDVPAFAATLAAPPRALFTHPVLPVVPVRPPSSGPAPITPDIVLGPGEDLEVAWEPFDGRARVSLVGLLDGGLGTVRCDVDARSGRTSVSAAALADVAGGALPIDLSLDALSSRAVDLRGWSVQLELEVPGAFPDGRPASAVMIRVR